MNVVMEIVYAYIGRLPPYIVDTVHQARTWSDNKITLLCDDLESPYLEQIRKYNVTILNAHLFIDPHFIDVVNTHIQKFCIAHKLGDRKLLFIRSFERFFLLQKYMEMTGAENILFLELDMLIYFNPEDLLPLLSQREITFAYTEKTIICSAFCYIKSISILQNLNSFFLSYIQDPKYKDFVSEMLGIGLWIENPENKQRAWMVPGLWKDERYNSDVWTNFETFGKTLFDSVGIAIRIDGPDATHREEWERRGRVWWGVEVNYNEFEYVWEDHNSKRVLYLLDSNKEKYKVQCLHVHNKNLPVFLSVPLESK